MLCIFSLCLGIHVFRYFSLSITWLWRFQMTIQLQLRLKPYMHMARCQVIRQSWTFCGLVGAFLDLGIAYFLLCCSAVAFFISSFLAFFGLSLPCPCNGLFGYPNSGYCVQHLLVDYPTKTISNLQFSVKNKFPFDAVWARNDHYQLNLKLLKDRKLNNGGLEFDGEASYSSFSDPRRSQHSLSSSDNIGKFDIKGKGVSSQRQRCSSLRRRRRGSIDYGRLSSASSYDHTRSDVRAIRRSPSDPAKLGNALNIELLKSINSHGRSVSDFEPNEATDGCKLMYGNATSFQNLESNVRQAEGLDGEDEIAIRVLEQELEEEQAARVALFSELEQERTAAATAADEAMAMISRLQEEKAAFEMEARQYQRILEEKSSYDAEEMDILKEIIVRREMEKHFLEREVEAYQKMIQDSEGLDNQVDDEQGQNEASFLDSSVNPMLILQQLSESIDKRGGVPNMRNQSDYVSVSVEKQTFASSGTELLIRQSDDETKIVEVLQHPEYSRISPDQSPNTDERFEEVQEKGMLSVDEIHYPHICKTSIPLLENDSRLKDGQIDTVHPHQECSSVVVDIGKQMLVQVREPHVHDVHVIGSECDAIHKMTGKESGSVRKCNDVPEFPKDESSFEAPKELEIIRSHSDTIDRLVSVSSSTSRELASELRRSSMPAAGHERLKIDNEVEWLRARLRAVQEEKEKLKSSLERQERGQADLRLLEDLASQIREIHHLTKPEKEARQGFLPPLSSKVSSKKKRSRSTSVGAGQSQSS